MENRKIFISVLGTNHYLKARYYKGSEPVGDEIETRFVQEKIIRDTCIEWNENDKIFFILTDEAKKNNWNNPAQTDSQKGEYKGLSAILNELNLSCGIEEISIPDGFSEDEIWQIFEKVYSKVDDGDEIYFDITHAFRSIPMLVIVLINYSKFLKKVELKSISYGAFEKLGPAYKVEKIPVKKRFVPILELKSFSELQDWTSAANEFLNFGNSNKMEKLINERINDLPKKQKNKLKEFPNEINKFSKLFSTVRGKEIVNGNSVISLNQKIDQFTKMLDVKASQDILLKVQQAIVGYKSNSSENGFIAIEWCIEHNLIQQAITLTQEMVLTFLCEIWAVKYKLNYSKKGPREMLSSLFGVANNCKISVNKWTGSLAKMQETAIKIKDEKCFILLIDDFNKLSQIRNSINHGGFVGEMKSDFIEEQFKENYKNIKEILVTESLIKC